MKPEEYTGEKISSGKYRVLMEELKWTNYFKVDNIFLNKIGILILLI